VLTYWVGDFLQAGMEQEPQQELMQQSKDLWFHCILGFACSGGGAALFSAFDYVWSIFESFLNLFELVNFILSSKFLNLLDD